jgi:hypothetical protein
MTDYSPLCPTCGDPYIGGPGCYKDACAADGDTPDPADVDLVAAVLCGNEIDDDARRRADDLPDEWCAECIGRTPAALNAARIALAALAAAGRLLPADAREQWSIRFDDGFVAETPTFTRAGAEQRVAELGGSVVRRVVGPWLPVPEPGVAETCERVEG